MKNIIIFVLLSSCLLFISCESGGINSNKNTNLTPESTAAEEIIDKDAETALKEFLAKNYKDWETVGLSKSVEDCVIAESCSMHLQKETQEKLITIIFRKLKKQNGHYYWLVSEPTHYEIEKSQIESIRNNWVKKISSDRDLINNEDWESIREMVVEELETESAMAESYYDDLRGDEQWQ